MKLPISLAVYTSTKGHFDRRDVYKLTIDNLVKQVPLDVFEQKIVHIKDSGECDAAEIAAYFVERDFTPIVTKGDWKHFAPSHHEEYLRDILRVQKHVKTEYYFHMEDDWVFDVKQHSLLAYLSLAATVLRRENWLLNVRFAAHANELERINGLRAKHGIDADALAHGPLIVHNDNWSFNPHMMRARDLFFACNVLESSFDKYKQHCEMGFAAIMKLFATDKLYLSAVNPELIRSIHIGGPPFEQLIPNYGKA